MPASSNYRQATPSRRRFERLKPRQPLDPMQPTGHAALDHVVPHAPDAVGPVARNEDLPHIGSQIFVAVVAPTERSREPCIDAATGDTVHPAQPFHRPDSSVLRDEGEYHVIGSAGESRFRGYRDR